MRLNIQTKFQTDFCRIALAVTSIWIMTGCGSTTARDSSFGGNTTNSSPSRETGQNTYPGNIYNLKEPPAVLVKLNGPDSQSPTAVLAKTITVQTSRTLKVKITPTGAPHMTLPGYTGWVFPYGCVRLLVTVNGSSQPTNIIRVDGVSQGNSSPCAGAPSYQVLDFSNAVTGNGSTNVVVSDPEYDNCRYYWPLNYGCQMGAIFKDHIVAATIQIQTDNTYMSP